MSPANRVEVGILANADARLAPKRSVSFDASEPNKGKAAAKQGHQNPGFPIFDLKHTFLSITSGRAPCLP